MFCGWAGEACGNYRHWIEYTTRKAFILADNPKSSKLNVQAFRAQVSKFFVSTLSSQLSVLVEIRDKS